MGWRLRGEAEEAATWLALPALRACGGKRSVLLTAAGDEGEAEELVLGGEGHPSNRILEGGELLLEVLAVRRSRLLVQGGRAKVGSAVVKDVKV